MRSDHTVHSEALHPRNTLKISVRLQLRLAYNMGKVNLVGDEYAFKPEDDEELLRILKEFPDDMQTWDENEVKRFLEAAQNTPYHVLLYTALLTGMRRSEILALSWQNVDLASGQISVTR